MCRKKRQSKKLKVRKVGDSLSDPDFEARMEKAEEIMGRYRNTLRELSR